jgi:hypothetical protein
VFSRPSSRVLSATPSPTLSTPSARLLLRSMSSTLSSARAVSYPAFSSRLIQSLTLLLRYPLRFRWLSVFLSSSWVLRLLDWPRHSSSGPGSLSIIISMGIRDGKCETSLCNFGVNADVQSYRQGSLWEMQCNDTSLIHNIFATQLLCLCSLVILCLSLLLSISRDVFRCRCCVLPHGREEPASLLLCRGDCCI